MKIHSFIFFIVLFFNLSCFSAETTKTEVKVGVIIPLSGTMAYVGEDIRNGLLLAQEKIQNSPYNFQLIYEDNRFELRDSVEAAQKLINVDKVDVIISLWDAADVIAPLTERNKILHISIRWNPDVAVKNKYTFTDESTYLEYAQSQLEMIQKMGAKKIAILQANTQGNMLGAKELQRLTKGTDIEVVSYQTYNPGERDFRTDLVKGLTAKPDLFVLYTWPPETEIILKQLQEISPNFPVTGYFEVVTELNLLAGKPFVAQFEPTEEFKKLFEARFGHPPKIRATHGYDILNLLEYAYGKLPSSPKPTSDQVIAQLMTVHDFYGAAGTLTANQTRNIFNPCVWKEVIDGKLAVITPDQIQPISVKK